MEVGQAVVISTLADEVRRRGNAKSTVSLANAPIMMTVCPPLTVVGVTPWIVTGRDRSNNGDG